MLYQRGVKQNTGQSVSRPMSQKAVSDKFDEVDSFDGKLLIFQEPVATIADLATTYPDAVRGWGSMVTAEGTIYGYNGTSWKNTGLTAFPDKIVMSVPQVLTDPEKAQARSNIAAQPQAIAPIDGLEAETVESAISENNTNHKTLKYDLIDTLQNSTDQLFDSTPTLGDAEAVTFNTGNGYYRYDDGIIVEGVNWGHSTGFLLDKNKYYQIRVDRGHPVIATMVVIDSTGKVIFKTKTLGNYLYKAPVTGCYVIFSDENAYLNNTYFGIKEATNYRTIKSRIIDTELKLGELDSGLVNSELFIDKNPTLGDAEAVTFNTGNGYYRLSDAVLVSNALFGHSTAFTLLKNQYYMIHVGYGHPVIGTMMILNSSNTPQFITGSTGDYVVKAPHDGYSIIFSSENGQQSSSYFNIKKITSYKTIEEVILPKTLTGADMLSLGDSIPARGQFQATIKSIIGLNSYTNKAVSGRRVYKMIFDRVSIEVGSNLLIEPSVLQAHDLILIGGHANDYGAPVPIGTISDSIGTKEIDTLTITAGASTSGDITITLNGIDTTIAVLAGDTIADVVAKIKAATVYNWAMSGASPDVIFTKRIGSTNIAPVFSGGATGVTGGFVVTEAGTDLTLSFYAECKHAITYLLENAPLVKIVAYGGMKYKGYFEGDFGTANTLGHTVKDYEDAWRIVCNEYGIPFAELFNECGINSLNALPFYSESDYVHPNQTYGMPRMGQIIAGKILQTIP